MALIDNVTNAYHLNEASGNAIDAHGTDDGTNTNITYGATGKLGDAYTYNGTTSKTTMNSGIAGDTSATIMGWFKTPGRAGEITFVRANVDEANNNTGWGVGTQNGTNVRVLLGGIAWGSDTSTPINDDAWHSFMVTRNVNVYNLYLDGGSSVVSTLNNAGGTFSTENSLGWNDNGDHNGELDEIIFFSSVKSTADFVEFHNSGNGVAYPFSVSTNMSINIADTFKDVDSLQINIGNVWKDVVKIQQNIGDGWKTVF